jgi:hypothetical protein
LPEGKVGQGDQRGVSYGSRHCPWVLGAKER